MSRSQVGHTARGCCCGGASPHVESFTSSLTLADYSPSTVETYANVAAHLCGFAKQRAIAVASFDEATLHRFRLHLPRCRCPRRRGRGVSPEVVRCGAIFLAHLRAAEIAARAPLDPPAFGEASERFGRWLAQHRGLAPTTLHNYQRALLPLFVALGEDPAALKPTAIRAFVVKYLGRHGRRDVKGSITALRAYLCFLAAEGTVPPGLVHCVPTVPQWRLSSLPKHIEPAAIERVVSSCDLATKKGRRDRALLLLLARLGLRAGDILAMTIADLDFQQGTLRVRGKNRQEALLPLPQDVGDALLSYLSRGRPKATTDRIFLCVNAPRRPLAGASTVSGIVNNALTRARITDPPSRGAHLLRHSAATAMLRAGSTLDAVAAVLRHRSPDSTALYAKVDQKMLGEIAQPWPGGAS